MGNKLSLLDRRGLTLRVARQCDESRLIFVVLCPEFSTQDYEYMWYIYSFGDTFECASSVRASQEPFVGQV
jgi:hypothetical protein